MRKLTINRSPLIGPISEEQYGETAQAREAKEQEILEKAVKEKEAAEAEKRREQKEREEAMRALIEEYKLQDAAVKTKRRQEEREMRAWEMMQRFKRDEYDKRVNLEERKRQRQQKVQYGNELWKDVVRTYSSDLIIKTVSYVLIFIYISNLEYYFVSRITIIFKDNHLFLS